MVTKHLVPRSQMTAVDVGSADHGTTTNSRAQAGGVPRTANENTSAEQPAGESVAASTSARSASARETELEPKVKKQKRGPSAVSRKQQTPCIDLTGVPTQPLILKNEISSSGYKDNSRRRPVKASSSKYTGVYLDQSTHSSVSKKWKAQIMVDGKVRSIGYYPTEEAAAIEYARAAYKYKPKNPSIQSYGGLDLSNISEQPLVRGNTGCGYKGVKKLRNRWQARVNSGGGKYKTLGTFDTAEDAARIYARALYYLNSKNQEE